MTWLKVLVVLCVISILPVPSAASIGTVLKVKQGAQITRAGNTLQVLEGMVVETGDAISTDGKGVVQLVFVDETKIAIGPNARMVLDVTMLRGNRKAKTFAVQALGGSFRFISGKSRKRAYSIKTPTATMAVRGTTFDMWIVPGSQSAMLVLEGTVRMCGLRGGSCRSTGRQCSLFATSQRGGVGKPVDQENYDKALREGFPFISSQERLVPPLQVAIEGCSGDRAPRVRPQRDRREEQIESVRAATPTPAAAPEPPTPQAEPTGHPDPGADMSPEQPDPPAEQPSSGQQAGAREQSAVDAGAEVGFGQGADN